MHEIDKIKLSDQTKLPLSYIMGTENYFYRLINQQKPCSEKLIKYVTIFYYIDIILAILHITSRG